MTVVKDDGASGPEEVAGGNEVAEAEEKNEAELMTDSKLPDDWSIIGSKGLDNEGSDGESVEVIPCEEEKSEESADGSSSKELAIETRETIVQTEEITLFRNLTFGHPGVIAFSIICHLLICLVFYSVSYDQGEFPDLRKESASTKLRPALIELIEDWEQMSSRSPKEKAHIINFLKNYFPLESFDEEIVALLEKDMMQDITVAPFLQKRRYTPNPPPTVQHKTTNFRRPPPPPVRPPVDDPPKPNTEDERFDCSNCKKYSSECKKFCKHNKGKNFKYYYDKIFNPIVNKISNFKNKF